MSTKSGVPGLTGYPWRTEDERRIDEEKLDAVSTPEIFYKGCNRCCFSRVDNHSGYPYCNFPDKMLPGPNPEPHEVVKALEADTAPDNCKLRNGGVRFEVIDERIR